MLDDVCMTRVFAGLLVFMTVIAGGWATTPAQAAAASTSFKVLAFYDVDSGDPAHNDYVKEALTWFPATGAQNGFTWEGTTDWSRLAGDLSAYKVVMFLDD